jgi:hypothetical protein
MQKRYGGATSRINCILVPTRPKEQAADAPSVTSSMCADVRTNTPYSRSQCTAAGLDSQSALNPSTVLSFVMLSFI